MEQHRTRRPQGRTPASHLARGGYAQPAGTYRAAVAPGASSASGRRVPPVVAAVRRLPNPRLTGLGTGLFATAAMVFLGFVDDLIFGDSPAFFGVLFLPVSAATALWVREADLVTAPIAVPIAFAAGTVPLSAGAGGFAGNVMGVVTALAMHAGWLYGGTLIAGVIASVRKIRQMGRRQSRKAAARAAEAARSDAAVRAVVRGPRRG
ncbi:DUF6542 domain-containing protein [Streptomyces sp. NRRL F-5126]|uniref:DUF6542 domain-containing protein n=1 Tax=Streptomyces sp. NRRL F-5126 TaxID=1463857 RepID=UPI000691049D